jgi:hypothetical protein
MNCADCRDKLVACVEGLLDASDEMPLREHLNACPNCRDEYQEIHSLQQRLIAKGQTAAQVSIARAVMRRVRRDQFRPERESIMSKLMKYRWGLGLGASAAVAVALLAFLVSTPKAQGKAAEVMSRGARALARLSSVHFRGQIRAYPQDNFASINPDGQFYSIELWKQFEPELKWRIEKPQRVVVMDGHSTVMLIRTGNVGVRFSRPSSSAFDSEWLHRIASLSDTIANELKNATDKGWKLSLAEETGPDGKLKSVVTVQATSGLLEDDYGKNKFFENADTRRVYRFDAQSELLESVQFYVVSPSGEVPIFELSQIDYSQPIDPKVWQLELPTDVSWFQEPQKLPDNEKYVAMTAEQAARAFFEACGRNDWVEAGKFISPVNQQLRDYLGGLQIVSLGDAFVSRAYSGRRFVPYEIKLSDGTVKKLNLALRNDNPTGRWQVDGGI